jgi:predicted TIM-barrel fold metal-dependent hydrolase
MTPDPLDPWRTIVIIDGHAHISASDYGNADVLLAQLDQAGIERALCVPGGMVDVRQFSRILSGRLRPDPNIPNHVLYEALDRHGDRLYGLVCINPRQGPATLETMRQGFARGCRGVKLAPLVHGFAFEEPVLEEVAAACAEQGFPVYSHVLPKPGSTTADYAALARRCPNTRFILGHMGFGPGDIDAIEFSAELDNLYLETSLGNWLILRDALARLGPGKLIFGSEFPLGHPKAELENVLLLEESAHAAILGDNILRLLGLQKTSLERCQGVA